jgi:hypothetical protein
MKRMSPYGLACLLYKSQQRRVSWQQCLIEAKHTPREFYTRLPERITTMSRKQIADHQRRDGTAAATTAIDALITSLGGIQQTMYSERYTRSEIEAKIHALKPSITHRGYVRGFRDAINKELAELDSPSKRFKPEPALVKEAAPEQKLTSEAEPELVEA